MACKSCAERREAIRKKIAEWKAVRAKRPLGNADHVGTPNEGGRKRKSNFRRVLI